MTPGVVRHACAPALAALLLAGLAACGGGGGAAASPAAPAPPPTTPTPPVTPVPTVLVKFTPSDAEFPNPERGFYRYTSDPARLDAAWLQELSQQGTRLIYTPADLGAWRNQPLPDSYLQSLRSGFELLRTHGIKAIVRFAYAYPKSETDYLSAQDAPLSWVQAHLAQLKPVMAEYADVVAVWQGGFIGPWGEWHTSSNNLTTDANKLAVRDALLSALPAGRMLQIRSAQDVSRWYPRPPQLAQLLAADAATGGRIGMHNDCFLASPDDVGTYFPPETAGALRAYVRESSAVTPYGGETCLPPRESEARMQCADILREGSEYHLTYLNQDYYEGFINNWNAQGCMAEVRRKLGYRLVLETLEHPVSVRAGGTMTVRVGIGNAGWARPMNPRKLSLVLVSAGGTPHSLGMPANDLRQLGSGTHAVLVDEVAVPATLPAGRYAVQIAAPDAARALESKPAFALRFANADVAEMRWDASTGRMSTGSFIDVQ